GPSGAWLYSCKLTLVLPILGKAVEQFIAQCFTPSSLPVIRQPADPPVIGVLAGFVELARTGLARTGLARTGIEALGHPLRHRGVVAEPDRSCDHQDVRRLHPLVMRGQASVAQPCSVMSGQTPGAMS